jgi:hypothetical protein
MKNLFLLLIISAISIIFLAGCTQIIVCNKPYILVGSSCCLDANYNSICDRDETNAPPVAQPPVSQTVFCYQETANASTAGDGNCGLIYDGNYLSSGFWESDITKTWDGDWNTYARAPPYRGGSAGNPGYLYVNYIKPLGTTGAYLQFKIGTQTVNITIPSDCLNYNGNLVSFYFVSHDTEVETNIFCKTSSTSWNELYKVFGGSQDSRIYEEAMWWEV